MCSFSKSFMSEKGPYSRQTERLKNMIQDLSKSPDLEDLPLVFYRDEVRYKALSATYVESSPERKSEYFLGENINDYEQKSYSEHMQDMGPRAKAMMASLLSLSVILGIAAGAASENELAGASTSFALVGATLFLFEKIIHWRLEDMPISDWTRDFYSDLKKVYRLCQRLQHMRDDGTYESRAHAIAAYQEAQELIIKMQREMEESISSSKRSHLRLVK